VGLWICSKIVKPYGWEDSRVEQALRTYDTKKLPPVVVGGKTLTPDEIAKVLPGAQFGPSPKANSYTVSVGGRLLTGENGKPLLLPLE